MIRISSSWSGKTFHWSGEIILAFRMTEVWCVVAVHVGWLESAYFGTCHVEMSKWHSQISIDVNHHQVESSITYPHAQTSFLVCETKLLTFCVLSSVWNHLPRAVNYSEKKNRTLFRKKSKISKKIQRKITLNPNKIHRYPKSRAPFEGVIYPSIYLLLVNESAESRT